MVNIEAATPESRLLQTLIDAYDACDVERTAPLFSNDFKFHSFPKMNERPDMTKDEYLQKKRGMMIGVTKVDTTIHDLVEAPGRIVVHATAKVTTRDGTILDFDTLRTLRLVEEEGELKIIELNDFNGNSVERKKFEADIAKSQAKV